MTTEVTEQIPVSSGHPLQDQAELVAGELRWLEDAVPARIGVITELGATPDNLDQLQKLSGVLRDIGSRATELADQIDTAEIPLQHPEPPAFDSAEVYGLVRQFIEARGSGAGFTRAQLKDYLLGHEIVLPAKSDRFDSQLRRWQTQVTQEMAEAGQAPRWMNEVEYSGKTYLALRFKSAEAAPIVTDALTIATAGVAAETTLRRGGRKSRRDRRRL